MAGMKFPPNPTTISPICTIETALLRNALVAESGYSWAITRTYGCVNPIFD